MEKRGSEARIDHRSYERQGVEIIPSIKFAERKVKKALDAVNDFKEVNHTELTLYNAAEKYLREHMGKHFDPNKLPPIKEWEKELAEKTAVKDALYIDYYKLKDDTARIEKIQWSVKEILHSDETERTPHKSWDLLNR